MAKLVGALMATDEAGAAALLTESKTLLLQPFMEDAAGLVYGAGSVEEKLNNYNVAMDDRIGRAQQRGDDTGRQQAAAFEVMRAFVVKSVREDFPDDNLTAGSSIDELLARARASDDQDGNEPYD